MHTDYQPPSNACLYVYLPSCVSAKCQPASLAFKFQSFRGKNITQLWHLQWLEDNKEEETHSKMGANVVIITAKAEKQAS